MDEIHQQEQAHLSKIYATLLEIRTNLEATLNTTQKDAARDLRQMSEEIRPDFGGADETIETLAAIETLNSVIDTYNQYHDFTVEKLGRVELLLRQPYFAKVRLKMRSGRPSRDVYIGAAGMTDEERNPLIVDWRSPVAETYYSQETGQTSYEVNGKKRTVELELRRQFDITRDKLNMYFDTTVAIEDSLLLSALRRHHTEKLQAITATIQREQNTVVRHADVPVLLVNGIAGSGKTSVLLQRIAYLLYRERKTLRADQVRLFTPNDVFGRYIDTVLPSMGESNPQVTTWDEFLSSLGLADHASGAHDDPALLTQLEKGVKDLTLEESDFRGISVNEQQLIKAAQVASAVRKFSKFPVGPRLIALVKDELHTRLERRLGQMARNDSLQEEMLELDIEDQVRIFGHSVNPSSEDEVLAATRAYLDYRFAGAHDKIESATWLRIDRIGMRILDTQALSGAEWVYLRLLIAGPSTSDTRFVMIDEVQDYSTTQLTVLTRYFSRAHFLLLGDAHQAIHKGSVTFDQIRDIFAATHGNVEECLLMTSYRSSPEITELFTSLLPKHERRQTTSVHREGTLPVFYEVVANGTKDAAGGAEAVFDGNAGTATNGAEDVRERYLETLRSALVQAFGTDGLTAVIVQDKQRVSWLAKQLNGAQLSSENNGEPARKGGMQSDDTALAHVITSQDALPAKGVILLDLALAKGLEFDQVIIADAQAEVYGDDELSRRRLYTAISRAMHRVTIISQGPMTPLLTSYLREHHVDM
ncbi:ATP-binding domain-containing protein [Atopobium sp. oral taxon 199]|uniref:HelD family protein n=1 Tax=Atopobium sp. oral taxon 199 TaxID=712156 RepID=UPI00034E8EFC|nr:ATP-binding domain-containing protein [Atopobium sp. oral taxon 199]EPD78402.1 DNA helicase II/ATP-dependent DNA helicase PcrA [Atopobium sp. oral taxon 199 str. F0494]